MVLSVKNIDVILNEVLSREGTDRGKKPYYLLRDPSPRSWFQEQDLFDLGQAPSLSTRGQGCPQGDMLLKKS